MNFKERLMNQMKQLSHAEMEIIAEDSEFSYELLEVLRWPDGFRCPNCNTAEHCVLTHRRLIQCNSCRVQTGLFTETFLHWTKLTPQTIIRAAWHLMHRPMMSGRELHQVLRIGYNSAWRLKRKLTL